MRSKLLPIDYLYTSTLMYGQSAFNFLDCVFKEDWGPFKKDDRLWSIAIDMKLGVLRYIKNRNIPVTKEIEIRLLPNVLATASTDTLPTTAPVS